MLTVTGVAARAISEAVASREKGLPSLLRVAMIDGKCGLSLGEAADGEQVIEHDGRPLLALDAEASGALARAVLDAKETENGLRLTLTSG